SQEKPESGLHVARIGMHTIRDHRAAGVRLRILPGETVADQIELLAGLLERVAGAQARDRAYRMNGAVLHLRLDVLSKRQIDVVVLGKTEAGGRNTDDRVRLVIECNGFSDGGRAAREAALPQRVA